MSMMGHREGEGGRGEREEEKERWREGELKKHFFVVKYNIVLLTSPAVGLYLQK